MSKATGQNEKLRQVNWRGEEMINKTMGRKSWGGVALLRRLSRVLERRERPTWAVKAPVYKAPPVYLSDWAGFYLGIHGGGGWADTKFDVFPEDNTKPTGGLFGGHAGYNCNTDRCHRPRSGLRRRRHQENGQ